MGGWVSVGRFWVLQALSEFKRLDPTVRVEGLRSQSLPSSRFFRMMRLLLCYDVGYSLQMPFMLLRFCTVVHRFRV